MESEVALERWDSTTDNRNRVFAAVFAHSDDLAILAGGLTMKLLSEGYTGYFSRFEETLFARLQESLS